MIILFARIFFFLTGFGLTVLGFVYIISYLNLLTIGYNFSEYVNYIIKHYECLYAPVGIVIMTICLFLPGGNKDELYL